MVELHTTGGNYEQACNRDTSDREVQVICKELGCEPDGARRVLADLYVADYSIATCMHMYI